MVIPSWRADGDRPTDGASGARGYAREPMDTAADADPRASARRASPRRGRSEVPPPRRRWRRDDRVGIVRRPARPGPPPSHRAPRAGVPPVAFVRGSSRGVRRRRRPGKGRATRRGRRRVDDGRRRRSRRRLRRGRRRVGSGERALPGGRGRRRRPRRRGGRARRRGRRESGDGRARHERGGPRRRAPGGRRDFDSRAHRPAERFRPSPRGFTARCLRDGRRWFGCGCGIHGVLLRALRGAVRRRAHTGPE